MVKNLDEIRKKLYAEKTIHGTSEFPVGIYDENVHDSEGKVIIFPHCHDEFELILITEGEGVLKIDDETSELKNGDAAFICGGRLHSFASKSVNCVFLPSYTRRI